MREVFEDPQIKGMGLQVTLARGERPPIKTVGCPVEYSDTPAVVSIPPPGLGEHTEAVLAEAGYDDESIRALRDQGILSPPAEA
jgi:crotonobetainyl-CoA:carnitine CoA-transferase CaiB-like acyl-CoA transferase